MLLLLKHGFVKLKFYKDILLIFYIHCFIKLKFNVNTQAPTQAHELTDEKNLNWVSGREGTDGLAAVEEKLLHLLVQPLDNGRSHGYRCPYCFIIFVIAIAMVAVVATKW